MEWPAIFGRGILKVANLRSGGHFPKWFRNPGILHTYALWV
jgi:hypothetical protein